jgi:beta-phosphoglucomutase-like phosphatase (HAD superfamily)
MGKVLADANQKISDRDEEIERLEAELADLKQNSATASELPEAADLLNRLKAKRKKSAVTLADVGVILGMIEES